MPHWAKTYIAAFFFVLLGASTAPAEQPEGIAWQGDLGEAWAEAQRLQRPILLYFTSDHCGYCQKMHGETFADQRVVESINAEFIPVVIDAQAGAKLQNDFRVRAFPTTFLIGPDATILDRIEGYVPPAKFRTRIAAAMETARDTVVR